MNITEVLDVLNDLFIHILQIWGQLHVITQFGYICSSKLFGLWNLDTIVVKAIVDTCGVEALDPFVYEQALLKKTNSLVDL